MKKITKLAYAGAIALLSAGFYACSSSDEMENVNPTYDGKAVKTSFTISIGDVKGNATRMSETSVQNQGTDFQGMQDIYLFPAQEEIKITTDKDPVIKESYINLPDFDAFDPNVEAANGKIYKDVTFSLGVSDFLFYGAIKASNKDNGELKPSYLAMTLPNTNNEIWAATPIIKNSSKFSDITFDLVPYLKGKGLDFVKENGASTLAVLNDIDSKLSTAITNASSANETDATTTPIAIVNGLKNLQKVLRNDKSTTTTADYKEYAGSSNSVKFLIEKLYNALMNQKAVLTSATATPVDYTEGIIESIVGYFTATPVNSSDLTQGYTLAWKKDPEFPTQYGVPDGAVAVKFITSSSGGGFDFIEISSSSTTPNPTGLVATSIGRYTYPARLYYTVNTKAMVKNEEYLDQSSNSTLSWADIKAGGTYTTGPVNSNTRSVIMDKQVEFAVGRLDVKVKVKPDVIIKDNGSGIEGDAYKLPQPVIVPADGYKMTGVLIGGQKQVGWNFEPKTDADDMTIWDNSSMTGIVAKQDANFSGLSHTLALETAENAKIRIALEFENTGNDFYGINHNLIPSGSKFYLIAELDPTTESGNTTVGNTGNKVFKQDFVTLAQLTINEGSLKNAYNVIPDLRSTKLEFGLSVDLTWQTGITFDQEFQ